MSKFQDKLWRLENLYWIENKKGERVKLKLNKVQKDYFAIRKKYNKIIICKSRKHGISTYEIIDQLDEALFNPGYHGVLVSYDHPSSKSIFSKVVYAIDNLNLKLKERIDIAEDTVTSFSFKHNLGKAIEKSSVQVVTSARGMTPTRAHISELPKMEEMQKGKAQEVLNGTTQAVPLGGYVTIESTPNGEGDLFHSLYTSSTDALEQGNLTDNDYYPVFYNWQWDDEEIAKAPEYEFIPEIMLEYQRKHELSDAEIAFYYTKYREMDKSLNSMYKNYPTTIHEAFNAVNEDAIFKDQIDLWYNKGRIGFFPCDKTNPVYVFQDIGYSDLTCLVWVQVLGQEFRIIDYYENRHLLADHYIDVIKNRGYRVDCVFLPHDSTHKSMVSENSVADYYGKAGINYRVMEASSEQQRIVAIATFAEQMTFHKENTNQLITHIKKVHKRNANDKKVVHDDESNAFDALGYAVIHAPSVHKQQRSNVQVFKT